MNYLRNKQEEARQSEIDEILNLRQTERFVEEQQDLLRLLKVELTCVIDQQEEAAARRNKIEAYNLDVTERLRSFKTAEEEIRNSKAKTVSKKQEYSLRLHDLEGQQDAVEHKKIEKTMELDAAKA